MKVLIVDEGRERSSVAAARALTKRGWTVGAASPSRPNLASRSQAVASWHEVPHTAEGCGTFVTGLADVVERYGYDAAFVTWAAAIAAVSHDRTRLGFPLGYGSHEGLMLAMDKERLPPVAEGVGLAVVPTVPATAEAVAALGTEVVVKPALQTDSTLPAARCTTVEQAVDRASAIERHGGRAIAQPVVDGMLGAVSLVAGPTGIVTYAQQVAELTWPPGVGITARGRTVAVDAELRRGVERLVSVLQLEGLVHLQFLVTKSGEHLLIDLNPRYYGSMALAISAGANHPHAWACVATGRPVETADGRPGARYQWFSRDSRASLAARDPRQMIRCLTLAPRAAHNLWSPAEPTLAPAFLLEQVAARYSHRARGGQREVEASARLHGVAEPTPAVRAALRTRPVPHAPVRAWQRIQMKLERLDYEADWLLPLQAARREALGQAADGPPRFLVRVDEFPYYAGYDEPRYGYDASVRFHEVMVEAGVPHLMSVVPQWTHEPLNPDGHGGRPLDDRDLALLDRMRSDGVVFAQHGTTHRTVTADIAKGSELSGRSTRDLEGLLEHGRRLLADVGIEPRIFVPPFNRFDANQWPVLAREYDVVTGGPETVMQMGFHGGPQWRDGTVFLPCYAPLYERADVALVAARRLIESQVGTWVPIVLHMGWEADEGFRALQRFARLIAPYAARWDEFLGAIDASKPG